MKTELTKSGVYFEAKSAIYGNRELVFLTKEEFDELMAIGVEKPEFKKSTFDKFVDWCAEPIPERFMPYLFWGSVIVIIAQIIRFLF